MSGWNVSIWARLESQSGSSRASVGGGDGDDPAVVGRGQAEDVAELPLGRDHVGGPGHEVEAELFEPLLGLGDVGHGASADVELGLFAVEDLRGELDGLLGRPELDVLLGQAPVLLLDRADLGHDLGLEPPDGGVGVEPGDDDRGPVGLQADGRAGLAVPAARRYPARAGSTELEVGRVGRRGDVRSGCSSRGS